MSQLSLERLLPIEDSAQLDNANFIADGLLDYLYPQSNGEGVPLSKAVQRQITEESPCLPEGAVRVDDKYVEATIRLGHLVLLRAQGEREPHNDQSLETGYLAGYPIQKMTHNHPASVNCIDTVEGYAWHRIFEVDTTTAKQRRADENNRALLLQPWRQPWREGGAPYPVMYTVGNVSLEDQRIIATHLMIGKR